MSSRSAPSVLGEVAIVIVAVLLSNYLLDPLISAGIAAIASLYWIIVNGFSVPRVAVQFAAIPAGMLVIGITMGLGHSTYELARDVWYFLMPPFGLAFGALAARRAMTPNPIVMGFLIGGTLLSMLFLAGVAGNIEVLGESTADDIRREVGAGYFPTVLCILVLLTFARRFDVPRPITRDAPLYASWVINSFALLLSFSRTMWLAAFIGIAMHFRPLTLRQLLPWLLLACIGAAVVAFPALSSADAEGGPLSGILEKIGRSVEEITPRSYESEAEINIYWRGYESLMGLQAYLAGSWPELILGQGFGALVDLGLSIQLADVEFTHIPILHNGYVYLLVKVGPLGLFGYLVWLFTMFKVGRLGRQSTDHIAAQAGNICQALVVITLFTTLVVGGVYNKYYVLPLMTLLGAMLVFATSSFRESARRRTPEVLSRMRSIGIGDPMAN